MIYLSPEQVIELHDIFIQKFGGLEGIREKSLLESALETPMMAVFGEELHQSVYDKAAAYLFHISRNHPFVDGNKRTAAASALIFLRANGEAPEYHVDEFVDFVSKVAEGKKDLEEISRYLSRACKRRKKS
jgi:death-on-curing protein